LRALAPYAVPVSVDYVNPLWLEVATRAMRVVGVLGCWGALYRLAQTNLGRRIAYYGGLAFFLHSAHWPLLAVVKTAIWRLMPEDSDMWMLVHYTTSVLLTILIALGLGLALAYKAPRIFSLMNGGRLLGQVKTERSPEPTAGFSPPVLQTA
jgi:hypothetical protein